MCGARFTVWITRPMAPSATSASRLAHSLEPTSTPSAPSASEAASASPMTNVAVVDAIGANPNGLEFLPNQELPLSWDQRHSLAMSLSIREPNAWGIGLTFDYGSGFPWTPFFRFERRQDPLLENSERSLSSDNATV